MYRSITWFTEVRCILVAYLINCVAYLLEKTCISLLQNGCQSYVECAHLYFGCLCCWAGVPVPPLVLGSAVGELAGITTWLIAFSERAVDRAHEAPTRRSLARGTVLRSADPLNSTCSSSGHRDINVWFQQSHAHHHRRRQSEWSLCALLTPFNLNICTISSK